MVKIKICGITRLEDAITAVEAGADALGFVFYAASPRHIFPEEASCIIRSLPPFVQTVGLFVNESTDIINETADRCGLDIVQLHGDESPAFCQTIKRRLIKALRIKDMASLDAITDYQVSSFLLDAWSPDAYGGTGKTFNWEIAECAARKTSIILAGGLTPKNVAESIRKTRPYGVDVSSSLELLPGIKDPVKVIEFIKNAKEYLP